MEKIIYIVSDIYTEPNKKGVQKLIKKDVTRLRRCRSKDIECIDEALTSEGTLDKKYCVMKMGGEWYKIKYSFDETKNWLNEEQQVDNKIGFNYGKRK